MFGRAAVAVSSPLLLPENAAAAVASLAVCDGLPSLSPPFVLTDVLVVLVVITAALSSSSVLMGDDQPMWGKRPKVQFTSRSAIKKTDDKMVEINKGLIKVIGTISFDGEPSGNPYQHLEAFEEICDLFNTKEDEFPISKVNKIKAEIRNFKQGKDNLVKAWERYKDLF
ncbi:hypothetical protein OSB04_025100 [Centaurea solstitialis]|uniref:Uncharacterized protein n=1 Tax=Centaurea solstitialis TaxID=347529 RepID=A0AA38T6V2_9ASTR|nr:hypothetical protein OSB04_025100 [Centaurea solstitialis]